MSQVNSAHGSDVHAEVMAALQGTVDIANNIPLTIKERCFTGGCRHVPRKQTVNNYSVSHSHTGQADAHSEEDFVALEKWLFHPNDIRY